MKVGLGGHRMMLGQQRVKGKGKASIIPRRRDENKNVLRIKIKRLN
jgi:hypothetical protein